MEISLVNAERILSLFMAAGVLCLPTSVAAERGHHRAHVHGSAELTLALEGGDLQMMFSSPAMDVLGFEHKATSQAQIEAVAEAKAALSDGAGLFSFVGTRCELRDTVVDVSAVLESEAADEAAHDDHDKHEGEDHDGHHDKHESDAHDSGESHTDISAQYEFSCADGGQLRSLRVGSEGLPFGLEKINVMWVSELGQGATVLTTGRQMVEFK